MLTIYLTISSVAEVSDSLFVLLVLIYEGSSYCFDRCLLRSITITSRVRVCVANVSTVGFSCSILTPRCFGDGYRTQEVEVYSVFHTDFVEYFCIQSVFLHQLFPSFVDSHVVFESYYFHLPIFSGEFSAYL